MTQLHTCILPNSSHMYKIHFFLLLSLFFFSSNVLAAVDLQLPDDMEIVALNGLNSSHVNNNSNLPDGINQIEVRLQKEFGLNFDKVEMEYSDVFVIKFKANNETLTVKRPPISRRRELEGFNNNPEIRILNKEGVEIEIHVEKLIKEGFQLMRNYEQILHIFNRSDSPTAVKPVEYQP